MFLEKKKQHNFDKRSLNIWEVEHIKHAIWTLAKKFPGYQVFENLNDFFSVPKLCIVHGSELVFP